MYYWRQRLIASSQKFSVNKEDVNDVLNTACIFFALHVFNNQNLISRGTLFLADCSIYAVCESAIRAMSGIEKHRVLLGLFDTALYG